MYSMRNFSLTAGLILFFLHASSAQKKCEVSNFYQAIEANYDTKVITKMGDLEEAETILTPMSLEVGKYKVDITRKGSNIYKIDGRDIYIETRYCYEYSYSEEVILVVAGNYGYDKGDIIFID
jgi:hypothetical protein